MEEFHPATLEQVQELIKKINITVKQIMLKELSGYNVTPHQLYILNLVKSNPNINLTALSSRLNLAKSSVCIILDKLAKEGYILRVENAHDRREVNHILTEKGEMVIAQTLPIKKKVFEKLLSSLTPEELENIRNSLQLLHDSIQSAVRLY